MAAGEYCFIVNPAAGGGLAGREWPRLHEKLTAAGLAYRHYMSEYRGHGRELAAAAFEDGARHLVAVGGDGTANEVLNGLLDVATPGREGLSLATVPWGTGNDWSSYYGVPSRPEELVRMFQAGLRHRQDIGRVEFIEETGSTRHHYFLNCAGTGLDSYLLSEMQGARGSRFRYFLFVLKCLSRFRAEPLQLTLDTEAFQGPSLLLEICLGRFAGAGMRFAPGAVTDDGVFEVLLIDDLNILQVLRSLSYLYNGRIDRHPAAHRWQCRSVSVAARAAQHLHCDGELVGRLPVQVEIVPDVLSVLVPGGQPTPAKPQ